MLLKNSRIVFALLGAVLLLSPLTACSNGDKKQDDSRYGNEHQAPATEKPYDGTKIDLPEGYVTAYDSQLQSNDIESHEIEEVIDVNGAKYTVHAPSKVHASSTIEGFDSFLVDLEIAGDEQHPSGSAAGCSYFVYAPSGLYATDLKEMQKQQELDAKRMEYEERGEEIPAEFYEQYHSEEPLAYTKTFEIPYDGDGTYTIEIRDFVNSKAYRVPLEIKLEG